MEQSPPGPERTAEGDRSVGDGQCREQQRAIAVGEPLRSRNRTAGQGREAARIHREREAHAATDRGDKQRERALAERTDARDPASAVVDAARAPGEQGRADRAAQDPRRVGYPAADRVTDALDRHRRHRAEPARGRGDDRSAGRCG